MKTIPAKVHPFLFEKNKLAQKTAKKREKKAHFRKL